MSKPMHKKNPFIVLVMVLVGLAAVGPLHAALALAAPSKTELVDIELNVRGPAASKMGAQRLCCAPIVHLATNPEVPA